MVVARSLLCQRKKRFPINPLSSWINEVKNHLLDVKGLNDWGKRKVAKSLLCSYKVDLMCFQESKNGVHPIMRIKSLGVRRFLKWGAL